MAVAQGIRTQIKRVKQSALGTAGSSGSKLMRRVTFTPNKESDTYASNEIASHQMSTGATEGPSRINGTLAGELSAGTYDLEFAALLRKDFAATAAITSLSITIAGSGPTYTITRSSGWFTDGVKTGDIIRLSVGSLNAANIAKNLLIISLTQTVATVVPLNGVALVAEGAIAGCTVTVIGKKTWTPTTAHTNDYFTWEKWYADLTKSELFVDVKPASADISIPATGVATVSFPVVGLTRALAGAEVLTSPTAESTSSVLAAVQGRIVVNGAVTTVTGLQIQIDGTTSTGDPEVGSNTLSDLQVGRIKVTGSFTAKFSATTLQTLRDDQTVVKLIGVLADSALATAEFLTFVMPAVKLFGDTADDGEKEIIRSYTFTAQYYGAGHATTADSHPTIISIQDSLAA
jgi:hypothetical protein